MGRYSKKFLKDLYESMTQIRFCEESLIELILNNEIVCPCHLYSGEEAIAAGIGASLKNSDFIFGNHRSHGHYLAKGGKLNELIAEIYCKEDGCSRGRGGSMHLIAPEVGMMGAAPIVAGTISLALGAALAASIRGDGSVAVCFFGDGATGEGVLYESLNFAALNKLPILFVCENNYYATHMSVKECRVENDIYKIAEPFCIESMQIEGNEILTVYETAKNAIGKCRNGDGPFFLECLTYRFRGHVGPDDNIQGTHTDIRPKDEIENWLRKDPIRLFEKYLIQNSLVEEMELREIENKVQKQIDEAHYFAKKSPIPNGKELMKNVYK